MGKAGFIVGITFGVFVTVFGLIFLGFAFTTKQAFTSWFAAFFSMFVFIIAAIIFYAANRARPKKIA